MRASAGAGDVSGLSPFSFSTILTQWDLDPFLSAVTVSVAGLYLFGVWMLHARGDRWPIGRTLSFVVLGMGSFFFATSSGLAAYDTVLLSAHMVQHMLLSMVAPLFLALGAPVTLLLRTLRARPRSWLLAVLHSRVARVLAFAPLTFLLFVISPWALYFTGWYEASLRSEFVHEMMHLHLVAVGSLFFWPLLGIDPVPGRIGYPFRLILVFLTLPFHAFLGVTILSMEEPIAGGWYESLHRTSGLTWLPDLLVDQHLAGSILWGIGDLVGLVFFAVLFVQWVRQSGREAAREDRRLDRLEARTGSPGPGGPARR